MSSSRARSSLTPSFVIEDEQGPLELEYAGVTVSWLCSAITERSKVAFLCAHKKHKAAKIIQSCFVRWKARQKIPIWNEAAVKIQKTWRGFMGRFRYFRILESTLKKRMVEHYHGSATKIQAYFRGYYSRKYIHDQCKLKELQLKATCELLECVANKTFELVRNKQLPGVYSLRNSSCLSKVEKLMALLQVKKFNEKCRVDRAHEVRKLTKAFEKSIRSEERTQLPFGPECKIDTQRRKSSADENQLVYQLVKNPKKPAAVEEISIDGSSTSNLSLSLYKRRKSFD